MNPIRNTIAQLEWLHRRLASLTKDTEGTNEGRKWKHWHDWAWAELESRRAAGEKDEPEALTNGKGDGA